MPLLPRKAVLAVAAVTDIALNARGRPVAAKALASRHGLSPRHLEAVLQALVRHGILKGTRGPQGGYELAREARRITADHILRAAGTAVELDCTPVGDTEMLKSVVLPVMRQAEEAFSAKLARINAEDLAHSAGELSRLAAE
jgi:Rrf2 family transcriptional regulator, iron-sulfur cluster assembly transcription factor